MKFFGDLFTAVRVRALLLVYCALGNGEGKFCCVCVTTTKKSGSKENELLSLWVLPLKLQIFQSDIVSSKKINYTSFGACIPRHTIKNTSADSGSLRRKCFPFFCKCSKANVRVDYVVNDLFMVFFFFFFWCCAVPSLHSAQDHVVSANSSQTRGFLFPLVEKNNHPPSHLQIVAEI